MMELTVTQKRQRMMMMLSGAFIIFFTGFPHVWSVYQPYVMEQAGWSQGQASMCFYLSFVAFVFGNIIGGRIQDRHEPKIAVEVGGGLFAFGIIMSAFCVISSPVPIYLTYGLLQGLGQGMVYSTILSTAQKWFPDRPGFASGVIVTANGLCGLIMAPASRLLLEKAGLKFTFLAVGLTIAVAWLLSTAFLAVPDKKQQGKNISAEKKGTKYSAEAREYPPDQMLRTKAFYFLLSAMMFGLMSYFIISPVSQTYQMEIGISPGMAVSAVMIGSVANAGMRLLMPSLGDKVGRSICIKAVFVISVAAMLTLSVSHSGLVTAAIIVMYGCYGGIMGSFPSFTSSIFGMEHSGENYGYVMLGIVAASFGAPGISKAVLSMGYTMQTVFIIGAVFAVLAIICLFLLDRELKKL